MANRDRSMDRLGIVKLLKFFARDSLALFGPQCPLKNLQYAHRNAIITINDQGRGTSVPINGHDTTPTVLTTKPIRTALTTKGRRFQISLTLPDTDSICFLIVRIFYTNIRMINPGIDRLPESGPNNSGYSD